MRRPYVIALGLVATATALGCGEHQVPAGPRATPVSAATVSLAMPQAEAGGIILTVSGPDLATFAAASAAPPAVVYSRLVSATQARVIVLGRLVAGPLLTVTFASPQDLSQYSASIEQIVDGTDALRADLAGFGISFAPAPR